jgi:hypothetical protein
VPTRAEIKNSANFAPNEVDVRELLALSLPHRSSPQMHMFSSDSAILSELHNLVGNFIVSHIRCLPASGKVYLPKSLRRLQRDIMLWRRDAVTMGSDSSFRPSTVEDQESSAGLSASGSMERASVLLRSSAASAGNSDLIETDAENRCSLLDAYAFHTFSPLAVVAIPGAAEEDAARQRQRQKPSDKNAQPQSRSLKRQTEGVQQEIQGWDAAARQGEAEDSSAWDVVAADCDQVSSIACVYSV